MSIVIYCADFVDKSHPYFDKYGIREAKEKKKAGLMSFDECTKDTSTLDDPIVLGIYTNPKEYIEQSLSSFKEVEKFNNKNVKHKSVSRKNQEITLKMYHGRLKSSQELLEEYSSTQENEKLQKVYQSSLKRTDKGIVYVNMEKKCLNRLSDKTAFLSNGLLSIAYGHPDWEEFVVQKRIKRYDDRRENEKKIFAIDEKQIVSKMDFLEDIKNERNVIIRNRHLEIFNVFLG